jgi:predicted nucleic acid-binding protein
MALRSGQMVFVDTGAWIALALSQDPLHARAVAAWSELESVGAKLRSSVPVVLETFTFLERNIRRHIAIGWKDSLRELPRFRVLECRPSDLRSAWEYFERRDLHKLSAVDASSFVVMKREKIATAFAFDHHFASVGFRMVG